MRGLSFGLSQRGPLTDSISQATQRIAGNNLAYAIGDSRMLATNSPAGGYNERYFVTPARQLLMGQLHLPYPNIVGGSGYTTQQIQENLFPDALASSAKTLILLCGTNDLGSNPATVAGRIATMANDWVGSASDRVVHVCDEIPWGGTTGDEAGHTQLRDHIRALSDPANGINIVPTWRASTGGTDDFAPLPDSFRDTVEAYVHPTIRGSIRLGRALAESLAPTLPAFDFHGRATDLSQSFALGTIASNDLATNNTLSQGAHTVSMVTFEGEVWCQIAFEDCLGAINVYRSSTTLPGGWVTNTTLFESNVDVVLLDGHENIRQVRLDALKQSGLIQPHYSTGAVSGDGDHNGSGFDAVDLSYPDGEAFRGTFWTPRYRLASDATQLRPWRVGLVSRTSLPMSGQLLIRRPQCRVMT